MHMAPGRQTTFGLQTESQDCAIFGVGVGCVLVDVCEGLVDVFGIP